MVTRKKPLLFLIFATSLLPLADARTITDLEITNVGQSHGDNDGFAERNCKIFTPTLKQIRHYFEQAYPVELHVILDARYSACYATGSIDFSDGARGKWKIASSGAGGIRWDDGGYSPIYYKHNQWIDIFECSYGMEDAPEC
jgi:hypothetical protein